MIGEAGVPGRDLNDFRFWREHARQARTLGTLLSGLDELELAQAAQQIEKTLKVKADSYRVPSRQ